ncbi:MAG: TAXI family TRAP transporter solute-binding subunit [Hyphomicrobiaceae bacterium]|nr:TAXI family TRAP transporter solute-binding subunit [Hyphomicrobiaceae bacterium]
MQKASYVHFGAAVLSVSILVGSRHTASAGDVRLPSAMTVTAYDTGTSGFNITVAVGKALKEKFGTEVRVLPAGNDVARLAPLKSGRAQLSAMGTGIYFAQEAVFEFAAKDWGPQGLRIVLSSLDCNGAALGVAADTGVKQMKDLKGKRVGFVVGSPALNQNALAMIAFGGLTKDDVKIVEFGGFGAMWKGMLNNDVDAAIVSTITGQARELEVSPRGLTWVAMPHSDTAGWERVRKVAPFVQPHTATCGAGGLSEKNPVQMGGFPYPIYVVYDSQPDDQVYAVTKAMIDTYDQYKDGAPGASGLGIKRQTTQWVLPFHAGAVRAFKEAGKWTDADERHNQGLLKRQHGLREAWQAYIGNNPPEDKGAFQTGWMAARKEALVRAGLDPIF